MTLTSAAGGLLIGLFFAVTAGLLASPFLLAVAFLRGADPALSALTGVLAFVGWPTAAFAAVQLAHLLAVAATSRLARRWVAGLTLAGAASAPAFGARSNLAVTVTALTLAAAAVSWRLETGLGPLAPSLKVPPGPGV